MQTGLRHGTWWDQHRDVPVNQLMEGRFTRLFPRAPAATFSPAALQALAAAMTAAPDIPPTPETRTDAEENPGIPAAYTYFGQFVDHDITFDPTSSLKQRLNGRGLKALVDFRTPRLDLDNLYGRGPNEQPYLYLDDRKMLLGEKLSGNPHDLQAFDVPRGPNGRALIGDPRNDENRIVTQLQATMLRFHNALADLLPDADLPTLQQQVRWHYQWVLVHDFLPTVVSSEVIHAVFPQLGTGPFSPVFSIPGLGDPHNPLTLMPVEHSVAAYRFGHSMIRPIYRINESISRRQIFSTAADPAGDLGGMRPLPQDWALDWQYFIDLDHGTHPAPPVNANDPAHRKPQHSYKIDTSLVNPLGLLPPIIASDPPNLALRNLERGAAFGLPSGQTVAAALGLTPLADSQILIGKATADPADPTQPITDIAPEFAGNAPLWTYVLAEAWFTSWNDPGAGSDKTKIPIRLGPVGGHLITETFAALLAGDPTSYAHAKEPFSPNASLCQNGTFGLAELINAALGRTP